MKGLESVSPKKESVTNGEKIQESQFAFSELLKNSLTNGVFNAPPSLETFGTGDVNQDAIRCFLNDTISFLNEQEAVTKDRQREGLYQLGQQIKDELFSHSPNISNFLPIPERLVLAARASRSEIIQHTFGGALVGELTYDISFAQSDIVDRLVSTIQSLTTPEQLDVLHQLRTVGADAIANGSWSRPALNRIRETYSHIHQNEVFPVLTHLAAKVGLDILEDEYNNPQLGVVRFKGQGNDSRLDSRFYDTHFTSFSEKIVQALRFEPPLQLGEKIYPMAKDAVVVIDRTGLPIRMAHFDVHSLEGDQNTSDGGVDTNLFTHYGHVLRESEHESEEKRHRVTVELYHRVYNGEIHSLETEEAIENAAHTFTTIFPFIRNEEWKIYFRGERVLHEAPTQQELLDKAGEKNGAHSRAFAVSVYDKKAELGEAYRELCEKLHEALENNDEEYVFELVSDICLRAHYDKDQRPVHSGVVREFEELRAFHQASFHEAEKLYDGILEKINTEDAVRGRSIVVQKIEQNLDALRSAITRYVEMKLNSASHRPILQHQSIAELMHNPDTALFGVSLTKDDILLMQHVHTGEMREKINTRLDVPLERLPLRSQVHFVRYLATVKELQFERLRGIIGKLEEADRINFLNGFLATVEDQSLSEVLLTIGEKFTPSTLGRLFSKYSELVDVAYDAEKVFVDGDARRIDAHNITLGILVSANRFLRQSAGTENEEDVLTHMSRLSADGHLYTQAFREFFTSVKKEGGSFDFEQLKGTSFEKLSGNSIAEREQHLMESLLRRNYAHQPTEFVSRVAASMRDAFQNPDSTFYMLRHKNIPIGFCRFDEKYIQDGKPRELYFGSFNVDQSFGNGKLGEAIFESAIAEEKKKGVPIHADCDPASPIARKYLEWDFVGTRAYNFEGVPSIHIELDVRSRERFMSTTLSDGQLIHFVNNKQPNLIVRELMQSDDMPELSRSFVLTRMIDKDKKRYGVFEKV